MGFFVYRHLGLLGCNIAIMNRFLPILFIISLFYFSCSEELQSGCTDCNAINYNADAVDDDGSCIFLNTNRLSLYTVQDSVQGPFFDWFYDEYLIDIVRDSCDSIGISINNYANITNSQGEINVNAQIIGDSIYIFYQIIEAKEQNLPSDYMTIFESVGYFKEDSIFLDLYYMNMYDPFIGHLWGKKN